MPPKRKVLAEISTNRRKRMMEPRKTAARNSKALTTIPVTANKTSELEDRDATQGVSNYDKMIVQDLKEELRQRRLKISGRKQDLIQRLRQHDHDRSIPAKQAMGTAARKRPEKQLPPSEDEDMDANFARRMRREERVKKNGVKLAKMLEGLEKSFQRKAMKEKKKRENIFGEATLAERNVDNSMVDWRVAQDLAIEWPELELRDPELWRKAGFTADQKNMIVESLNRMIRNKLS